LIPSTLLLLGAIAKKSTGWAQLPASHCRGDCRTYGRAVTLATVLSDSQQSAAALLVLQFGQFLTATRQPDRTLRSPGSGTSKLQVQAKSNVPQNGG